MSALQLVGVVGDHGGHNKAFVLCRHSCANARMFSLALRVRVFAYCAVLVLPNYNLPELRWFLPV